jgi:uncharacterized protein
MSKNVSRAPYYFVATVIVGLLAGMLLFVWSDGREPSTPPPVDPALLAAAAKITPLRWPPLMPKQATGTTPLPYHRVIDDQRRPTGTLPAIAIVIDDCGLDVAGTKAAIALPPAVTLSFLPYGQHSRALAKAAQVAKHDVLLHLPMQPLGNADPGPDALTIGLSPQEVGARVDRAFAALPSGMLGLNNHMGSRFTADATALQPVMQALSDRGLFFLDSVTSPRSAGVAAARSARVPVVTRDIFLDDTMSEANVQRQLNNAERVARERGSAIAIGHPHAVTLKVLQPWLASVQQRGYRLVPLSALVHQ